MSKNILVLAMALAVGSLYGVNNTPTPKLPIGMNIDPTNYYSSNLPYRNVMNTSTDLMTFDLDGPSGAFNTEKANLIPRDRNGYPLEIPYVVKPGTAPQGARFMINNVYKGKFLFTYDGEGTFRFDMPSEQRNGKTYITLDGKGGHVWFDIRSSKKGNHVRNIKILPEATANDTNTLFDPLFVEGLKPFHCLRFMDWSSTNGSKQRTWDQRPKPDYFTQGLDSGGSIEHAILLCNEVHADAWFCIPHQADDNYIRNFAILVRDKLDPTLKVYIEYSNELWNWGFEQASYVVENAKNHPEQYVKDDLNQIDPRREWFQVKDAYMMQRTFKIWSDVFGNMAKDRLVRVAAVQAAWSDNSRIILEYLFKKDKNGKSLDNPKYATSTGAGCDALSPGGYFYFTDNNVKIWENMDPSKLTGKLIIDAVDKDYWETSGQFTAQNAELAKSFNVDLVVYEGGQHLVPPGGREGPLAEAIWAAQIEPKMYDIYMKLFKQESSPEVNCKLFCAYNYVTERKARWGSWGHLENLNQLKDPARLMQVAPKYQALLDANEAKE